MNESRMALDDNALEMRDQFSDRWNVARRYGARIEEAPGVVELDPARWREFGERCTDLLRDGPSGNGVVECVLPEITKDTAPRTLAICQKYGGDRYERPNAIGLLFD